MATERRLEKIQMLLKEEISKIMDRDLEFPEGTLVTITRVDISHDKHYADILVSILGKSPKEALEILTKRVYNVQRILNRKMKMRPVPKIRFKLDKEELRREKVEKSLANLKRKGEI